MSEKEDLIGAEVRLLGSYHFETFIVISRFPEHAPHTSTFYKCVPKGLTKLEYLLRPDFYYIFRNSQLLKVTP